MRKTNSKPKKPTLTDSESRATPPTIAQLREYLTVACLDEETAQKLTLIKLLQRMPQAASWLASLIEDMDRKVEFVRLIAHQDLERADAEKLNLHAEELEEMRSAAGKIDSGSFGHAGISELELSAVVALGTKRSTVLDLSDRWLLTTVQSAKKKGNHPASHILPMLEFAERVLGTRADTELLSVARAAVDWEKCRDDPMDDGDWRKHVFRHLLSKPKADFYEVHEVLDAIPLRLRAVSSSGEVTSGVRAVDIDRFLHSIGVRRVWKKKRAGRKKSQTK